jgi:hypothetical protein
VSFIMRERNLPQLKSAVAGGATNFLSVSQFAATYGQSPASIAQLTSYLARFGISTQVYADNVDVVANGTAGQFDQALSVQQKQFHVPARSRHGFSPIPAQTVHGTAQSPMLPGGIPRAGDPRADQLRPVQQPGGAREQERHQAAGGSSNSCRPHRPGQRLHLRPLRRQYGLNPLYKKGATGPGGPSRSSRWRTRPGRAAVFLEARRERPGSKRSVTVVARRRAGRARRRLRRR